MSLGSIVAPFCEKHEAKWMFSDVKQNEYLAGKFHRMHFQLEDRNVLADHLGQGEESSPGLERPFPGNI
jgi:hypothetical protein